MNEKIEIDGNDPKWEHKCWQNAENQNSFTLINFTLEVVPECHSIAKKYGYELRGKIPPEKPGVCQFIPRNYHTSKMAVPYEFNFSGYPENQNALNPKPCPINETDSQPSHKP